MQRSFLFNCGEHTVCSVVEMNPQLQSSESWEKSFHSHLTKTLKRNKGGNWSRAYGYIEDQTLAISLYRPYLGYSRRVPSYRRGTISQFVNCLI